jgi:nicotinate-nucleotide adenylyltransferase
MNENAEQVGVLGGTFNPIHHGHLITARAAMEQLGLDRLLIMPNTRSPLRLQEELMPASVRLEMVRLAVADEPGLEACDVETSRKGTSYLVDSLQELRARYTGSTLHFLMGVDSLTTFERWREVERIVELAQMCVMPRPGMDAQAELAALEARCPVLKGRLRLMAAGPHIDISSTDIRERVLAGKSIRYLVPDAVAATIRMSFLPPPMGRIILN